MDSSKFCLTETFLINYVVLFLKRALHFYIQFSMSQ